MYCLYFYVKDFICLFFKNILYLQQNFIKYERHSIKPPRAPLTGQTTKFRIPQ